ncbi:dehydrogenase E1 component subunit alpha/beta [Oligoflexia bacterium]|nr:dehydrogenase E1 component subunit alpha/beta [Oligoflexia bacterium]
MKEKAASLKVINKDNTGTKIPKRIFMKAYTDIVKARLIDDKIIILYKQNKCHFQISVAGHETVQAAAAQVFNLEKDWFFPYYRDLALCVGVGMTAKELMLNALNKEDDPNSHGRQMPEHFGHKRLRIVSQSSPTGTQLTQAVGVALGARVEGVEEVVYVSIGEGGCCQGDFHEALNWAAREKLPVVFLVQNNGYAISVSLEEQHAGDIFAISSGYENLKRDAVDGTNFVESYTALKEAYDYAAAGNGPAIIEAHVPRLQSHSISDDHGKYRDKEELATEQKRDPIPALRSYILENKIASKATLDELELELKADIDEAARWAEEQPDPVPEDVLKHVLVDQYPLHEEPLPPQGEAVYMVDAINHALHEELERNPHTYVFGQDVAGGKGGVFTATTGLTSKWGKHRCFNTPLVESANIGIAIGLATRGLKPVSEIQFGDYIWTGMMHIRNELAMMNYRSGGEWTCPAVVRVPVGGYIHGGPYHSQNIEATFAHLPGLIVLYPSNATDAKGLLKSAIRANDPVLFLEHKGLYRQMYAKGAEGNNEYLTPIGKAKVVREGQDATIVSWGALVNKSLLAAAEFEKRGKSVEVIDVRTIAPLDVDTIFQSVRKTNRVLIAHEDVVFGGFGSEIAAQISADCFTSLDAPILRVGMKHVAAVAHSPVLESAALPQNQDVIDALEALLAF